MQKCKLSKAIVGLVTALLTATPVAIVAISSPAFAQTAGAASADTKTDTESEAALDAQQSHTSQGHEGTSRQASSLPSECVQDEAWNPLTGMCIPLNRGSAFTRAQVYGSGFLVGVGQTGERGEDKLASPNVLMGEIGTTLGERHFLNLEVMLTGEKWTFPQGGYPQLFQAGGVNENGVPYVDQRHPNTSPIMGLTLSDTFSLGSGQDHLRVFFSPRGQSTEGPLAYWDRPTAAVNPDVPLGHYVGQDLGQLSSTVAGAAIRYGSTQLEVSGFNGRLPRPDKVDLKMGAIDSVSARLTQYVTDDFVAMVSFAYVDDLLSEQVPGAPKVIQNRYSGSVYSRSEFGGLDFYNTLILGFAETRGLQSSRFSVGYEFLLEDDDAATWGRLEVVERGPAELGLAGNIADQWVTAVTGGYTYTLANFGPAEIAAGASVTGYFISQDLQSPYGQNPWAGKVFLQLSGMDAWDL